MIPFTPRPTFKRPNPDIAPHLRPSSPLAPVFEPLSPTRPAEPTLNLQESAFSHAVPSAPRTRQHHTPHNHVDGASHAASPSASTARTALPNNRKHQRTPSTISDLADAALKTTKPLAHSHPQTYPQSHPHPQPHYSTPHYSPLQHPMPPASYSPQDHREPAAKRARSELELSPHSTHFSSRPSTSHVPPDRLGMPHNVEQNIDRARRQSSNAIPSEDALLLLNFASRVQPRSVKVPSPAHDSSVLQPPALAPSVLSPPTFPASAAIAPTAEQAQGPPHDPSASLPSPRDTNMMDEETKPDAEETVAMPHPDISTDPESRHTLIPAPTATQPEEQHSTSVPLQTRTPPEEEQATAPTNHASAPAATVVSDSAPHESSTTRQSSQVESLSTDTAADTDSPKSRPRRGWPKGKPRGPRNKTGSAKPRPPARRTRASAKVTIENGSTSSGDDNTTNTIRIRRKSETDLSALRSPEAPKTDSRQASVPPHVRYEILPPRSKSAAHRTRPKKVAEDIICSGCSETRESSHGELDQWIGCNGCKRWFHYDCAGFRNERDVRDVDKFFCKPCEPKHGNTTYVRKSTRTHTNVDYAGLNQGILKTSDEDPEHHYIQPIKDGTFTFDPECFPRMRPELVTAEYFQTCASFTEPVLIPAEWNPKRRPDLRPREHADPDTPNDADMAADDESNQAAEDPALFPEEMEYETSFDDGQDKLGMIVPQGLTVRHVANIVGPSEPLEVIDVKTQGTEGRWNLAKFADYYESEGEKAVRNVISLEVSHTKLGRLLQRPKVVRQIDLQDSVWPAEESAKGNYPKVQFYCLMSVADSFTDFHIDFGGSSVYYHIVRGRKTFFFIPPKASHLKAYEDWNNSPEQNFTWLPTKTKECYRVDLYEGDTMLIPSGWIHAVWTPTNSLVIGGNFLTRLHYSTQFRIVDIEKANKTPLKFRYPQFQKVMWYTVIKYLETDPLPDDVAQTFFRGARFHRERPIWQDFFNDASEYGSCPGMADYNARYYSQAELDGLPELISFIFRTVMISLGRIEGVSEETRKKVVRSIPKSHGDPLDVAKAFALWVAWKRGDEDPPAWAHPEADLPDKEAAEPKKLSARALKQLQRQEAINANRVAPDRQSARQAASREAVPAVNTSPVPEVQHPQVEGPMSYAQYTSTPKTSVLGPKRVACDACRKRRIRCKHKEQVTQTSPVPMSVPPADSSFRGIDYGHQQRQHQHQYHHHQQQQQHLQQTPESHQFIGFMDESPVAVKMEPLTQSAGPAPPAPMVADANGPALVTGNALLADPNSKRGRSKACFDCRKSKRRCVHDENGKLDPVKAEQSPVPRGSAAKKRKIGGGGESPTSKKSRQSNDFNVTGQTAPTMPYPMGNGYHQNMPSAPPYQQHQAFPDQPAQQQWQQSAYMYPDPMDHDNIAVNNGPYHPGPDGHMPYSQSSLEQLANDVLDSRYVNNDEDGGYTVPQHGSSSGAVHPGPYPLPTSMPQSMPHESHDSSDSGVAFVEAQQMMGGPVQEIDPPPETGKIKQLDPNGNYVCNGSSKNQPLHQDLQVDSNPDAVHEPPPMEGSGSVQGDGMEPEASIMRQEEIGQDAGDTLGTRSISQPESPETAISHHESKSGVSNIPLYEPPSAANRPPLRGSRPAEHALTQPLENAVESDQQQSASKTPNLQKTFDLARKQGLDNDTSSPRLSKTDPDHNEGQDKIAAEVQDLESERLARELQDQEWGCLRRRSKEAI